MSAPGHSTTEKIALEVHCTSAKLANVEVLSNIRLRFPAGRWCSIVGPNGAGKSTLLKVMAGLLPAHAEVRLLGRPLAAYSRREKARTMSWLGQGESAGDDLSAWDVAMLGRLPHRPWLGEPGPRDRQAVEQALRATQAWDWRHRPLGALSGGERQRVLLARALAVEAEVLLMDEPLANLDPPHQADWLRLVRGLAGEGKTVISVLHEITLALQADDMVLLGRGRVAHHGAATDAATHRALASLFDHRIAIEAIGGRFVALPRI